MALTAAKPRAALLVIRLVTIAILGTALFVALLAWSPQKHLHRGAGHTLLIVTWLGAAIFIGVVWRLGLTSRRWSAVVDVIVALCAIAFCFLLSVSGFMGSETADAATQLRFLLLHRAVFPSLTFLALGYMAFRPWMRALNVRSNERLPGENSSRSLPRPPDRQ